MTPTQARPRTVAEGCYTRGVTALVLILWVLIASGCAGGISGATTRSASSMSARALSAAGNRPFVFRTRTELVLATPARVITRFAGTYADAGFAQDNSHIYALDGSGVLTAARVDGGMPRRVDCRCDRIFPLHDSVVGWWQGPDGFVQADLRDTNPTVPLRISLPPPEQIEPGAVVSGPRLLAAGNRTLILDQVESPPGASWSVNHLSLVDVGTGAVRKLGPVDGVNTAMDRAVLRPDGQIAAVYGYARDTIACGAAHLLQIDLMRQRLESLDLPAPFTCSFLADLRWDDAALTVTDVAWEPSAPDRLITAVWDRSATQWKRRGGDDTLRYGALAPSAALEIRRTEHTRGHEPGTGDLTLTAADEMQVLAHDVLDLRLPHV
ncbi:hypothetical protein [Nocardia alni]|uniref:hypothetical protein n=1 Tax=Nocardia alni TaxID=2815723 RepID=UPI001C22C409|nr:hypothetical protein [Nocardia alni]